MKGACVWMFLGQFRGEFPQKHPLYLSPLRLDPDFYYDHATSASVVREIQPPYGSPSRASQPLRGEDQKGEFHPCLRSQSRKSPNRRHFELVRGRQACAFEKVDLMTVMAKLEG